MATHRHICKRCGQLRSSPIHSWLAMGTKPPVGHEFEK